MVAMGTGKRAMPSLGAAMAVKRAQSAINFAPSKPEAAAKRYQLPTQMLSSLREITPTRCTVLSMMVHVDARHTQSSAAREASA